MNRYYHSQRGSVVLLGMILTVVLGIVLSSYIALCSNALRMSQWEYQSSRAVQMAENGMEEAFWALNQTGTTGFSDGSLDGATIDWTLVPATGIATATITGFPSEGNVTRAIGIRVLNYKTPTSGIPAWSSSTSYSLGDYASVNIGGVPTTVCCAIPNGGHSPAPSTATDWNSATSYSVNAYVSYGGALYRCRATPNIGKSPEKSAFWTPFWVTGQIINSEGIVRLSDGTQIRRQLFAITTKQSLSYALAAVNGGGISLSNVAATIDSYDSSTGAYAAGTASYSAVVSGTNVDINSATIKGYVAIGSAGALSFNADGYILAPSDIAIRNPSRIITGTFASPAAVAPPSSPVPQSIHDFAPSPKPIYDSGWTPIYQLSTGTYLVDSDLHLGNTGWLVINGNVKLIVPQNLWIGDPTAVSMYRASWNSPPYSANTSITPGTQGIRISSGAKLELYVGGDLAIYAGGIDNMSTTPANLTIFSTATTGSPVWDIRSNQPFYGTINAPRATFTIYNDSGTPAGDLFGAVLAKNINLRGGASTHYDMSLRNSAPSSNISSGNSLVLWREVASQGEPEFFSFNYP